MKERPKCPYMSTLIANSELREKLSQIVDGLRRSNLTLGFAESCTGGRLSATLVELPGVSDVFAGSVVCYKNLIKQNLLNVPSSLLKSEGAVSRPVVVAMAKGVLKGLDVDWALAVTGIAGPSGGTSQKPVGTVWFCVVGPESELSVMKFFSGDRLAIQEQTVSFAIEILGTQIQL